MARQRFLIAGRVQGVGFRPFVARTARELQLCGFVRNTLQGVEIECEGSQAQIDLFLQAMSRQAPLAARIDEIKTIPLPFDDATCKKNDQRNTGAVAALAPHDCFQILSSEQSATTLCFPAALPPDRAPCAACLQELQDPCNRRYAYPFISCDDCGPRFSIATGIPFDRARTTMVDFPLCPHCAKEYASAADRRFYAQTISCPVCGPQLRFTDAVSFAEFDLEFAAPQRSLESERSNTNALALQRAIQLLFEGKILALKGVGGYQLVCLASADAALQRLRKFKNRKSKPFALMVASLQMAQEICETTELEARFLVSPAAPIVLLRKKNSCPVRQSSKAQSRSQISELVAPGLGTLGVMGCASPLHYLLAQRVDRPLVVTSGNQENCPMVLADADAFSLFRGRTQVADGVLWHNRSIAHVCDDSLLRCAAQRPIFMRLGRGFAPVFMNGVELMDLPNHGCALGFGGQQKATFSLLTHEQIVLSQHLGDLENLVATENFLKEQRFYHSLYAGDQECFFVASDVHPQYESTLLAQAFIERCQDRCSTTVQVPHHEAHLYALLADLAHNEKDWRDTFVAETGRKLCFVLDGTGNGSNYTLGGCEVFAQTPTGAWQRMASLHKFRLPGGSAAIREPRRVGLSLLYEIEDFLLRKNELGLGLQLEHLKTVRRKKELLQQNFSSTEWYLVTQMLEEGFQSPGCSSAGRLFDGFANLLGLLNIAEYEAQGPLLVEQLARSSQKAESFYAELARNRAPQLTEGPRLWKETTQGFFHLEWQESLGQMLWNFSTENNLSNAAFEFHFLFARAILELATVWQARHVLVTGGVFQNALLIDLCDALLHTNGICFHTHKSLPPNDAALSVGQALYSAGQLPGSVKAWPVHLQCRSVNLLNQRNQ